MASSGATASTSAEKPSSLADTSEDAKTASETEVEETGSAGTAQDDGKTSTTCDIHPWDIGLPKPYVFEERFPDGDDDESDDVKNMYTNIPAANFHLRGPGYLNQTTTNNTKLKIPSKSAVYSCIGLNVFTARYDLSHAAEKVQSLKEYLAERLVEDAKLKGKDPGLEGEAPVYLIYTWVFSNLFKTEYTAVVHVCRRTIKVDANGEGEDPVFDRTFFKWLDLPSKKKDEKLKYCPKFSKASPQLLGTIDKLGGQRPVIIGKKLNASYYKGENYLEIDLDVGSSTVASMLNGIALKSSGHLVVDESVCIEAQTEEELPERALFAVRWDHCTIQDCGNRLDDMGQVVS